MIVKVFLLDLVGSWWQLLGGSSSHGCSSSSHVPKV